MLRWWTGLRRDQNQSERIILKDCSREDSNWLQGSAIAFHSRYRVAGLGLRCQLRSPSPSAASRNNLKWLLRLKDKEVLDCFYKLYFGWVKRVIQTPSNKEESNRQLPMSSVSLETKNLVSKSRVSLSSVPSAPTSSPIQSPHSASIPSASCAYNSTSSSLMNARNAGCASAVKGRPATSCWII